MVRNHTPNEEDFARIPIVGAQPRNDKEEQYLREVCEYEFLNLEDNGLSIRFPYGSTNHSEKFTFFHGGKYKVPRHVARHVETRATPRNEWRPDGTGRMHGTKVGDKPRFQMRQVYAV